MSCNKIHKNQDVNDRKLLRQYSEVMKHSPIIVQMSHNSLSLKQPSLLEEVDSVTTYEVSAIIQEYK